MSDNFKPFRPPIAFCIKGFLIRATLLFLLTALLVRADSADMVVVKTRLLAEQTAPSVSASSIASLRANLSPDGTWPDIDYASTAATNWPPGNHLTRVRTLARAYAKPLNPLAGDASLLTDIHRAFDAWISADPTSSNWYQNEISAPQLLGEIMSLAEPQLSASQTTSGLTRIARAYIPRSNNSGTNTGANRIDRAYATLMRALIAADFALASEAFFAIGDTILVTTAEGVQPDQSYQQHGAQLHIQGYGFVFLSGTLRYSSWAAGTKFAFDPLQLRVLTDFLLDGVQWFIRGDSLDFTAAGRGLTRAGQSNTAAGYRAFINSASAINGGYRAQELLAFSQRLGSDVTTKSATSSTAHSGHRHFWRSDSSTHHRPQFSTFLKFSSTRTLQPESGNGEGLKNLHLADGVTLIQRHGNEYDDIMPVWNWQCLPGTTTQQAIYSLKPSKDWGVAGTSTHAGGLSDGIDGSVAFRDQRLGVAALKSWFFLGDRMIALGADIQAPNATAPVLTTLNQCLKIGNVTHASAPHPGGTLTLNAPRWVHHDGIGYFFPTPPAHAILSTESRTGTWQEINTTQANTPVTRDVFSLQINHGTAVSSASYAYIVAPVASPADMENSPHPNILIAANNTTAQAVTDPSNGVTAVNFWQAGTAAEITANAASCILTRENSQFLEVSLADPTQANTGDIVLEINRPVAGRIHVDTSITIEQISPTLRLRASMANSAGRSLRAKFFLRPHAFEQVEIHPSADTFAHDDAPDTSHGTDPSLTTKLIQNPGFNRLAFLRFDLSELTTPPIAASLNLLPTLSQFPGLHGLHPLSQGTWNEADLTWRNRPQPAGPPLALWVPTANAPVRIDLTPTLAQASPRGILEFSIAPQTRTSDGLVKYASRENPDSQLRPVLHAMLPREEIEIWRITSFGSLASTSESASDTADPDHDGLPNAIEFVLGTSPNTPSHAQHPSIRMEQGRVTFSYRRTHASHCIDVIVETSNDLASWQTLMPGSHGVTLTKSPIPGLNGIDQIEVSMDAASPLGSPRFLRMGTRR